MSLHLKMADGGPWNTYQRVSEFLTNKTNQEVFYN